MWRGYFVVDIIENVLIIYCINKSGFVFRHIPKAKATTVVETPEMRRLAENTKLQSQVKNRKKFASLTDSFFFFSFSFFSPLLLNCQHSCSRSSIMPISKKPKANSPRWLTTRKLFGLKPTPKS